MQIGKHAALMAALQMMYRPGLATGAAQAGTVARDLAEERPAPSRQLRRQAERLARKGRAA